MSENTLYYYCCKGDSPLGKKLLRLIDRYGEVVAAASELCEKIGAIEFLGDVRYAAGGISAFVMKGKLRAKKLLVTHHSENGNDVCVPNPPPHQPRAQARSQGSPTATHHRRRAVRALWRGSSRPCKQRLGSTALLQRRT